MSINKDYSFIDEAFENERIRTLKTNLDKFETVDAFVEQNIKTYLPKLSNELSKPHKSMLSDLKKLNIADDTKFKDYDYFKEYCLQLKKDFKSNYKFTIIQEPTDDNFGQKIISIQIITTTKNYIVELANYRYYKDNDTWFDVNGEDYYLYHENTGEILSLDATFNITKMVKQIINKNKENKIYKLDLRSNAKRFLLSKQPKELINEKAQITIKKIEDVKKSNFDKEDMDIFWRSYISDDRDFCDVMLALAEYEIWNDDTSFYQKLKKTAKALNLPISQLTPFLLKYLILWTEENKGFNRHLERLSQLIINDELEEKTNIKDVAQGKVKSNKNRFCLSDEMKSLIDDSLKELAISDDTNYIKFLSELRITLSNSTQRAA